VVGGVERRNAQTGQLLYYLLVLQLRRIQLYLSPTERPNTYSPPHDALGIFVEEGKVCYDCVNTGLCGTFSSTSTNMGNPMGGNRLPELSGDLLGSLAAPETACRCSEEAVASLPILLDDTVSPSSPRATRRGMTGCRSSAGAREAESELACCSVGSCSFAVHYSVSFYFPFFSLKDLCKASWFLIQWKRSLAVSEMNRPRHDYCWSTHREGYVTTTYFLIKLHTFFKGSINNIPMLPLTKTLRLMLIA
jgi:hypothetical protein